MAGRLGGGVLVGEGGVALRLELVGELGPAALDDPPADEYVHGVGPELGILIGVLQHKVPIGEAFSSYTIMSIGDGLVSQIPALIISIAAGFLVSKAGVEGSADKALVTQLATNPISLGMVSATAGVLAVIPGMPIIPFAALSVGAGMLAWRRSQKANEPEAVTIEPVAAEPEEEPPGVRVGSCGLRVLFG